jgi:ABC-type branched-subunit amino acid transport system substrate-binding protein
MERCTILFLTPNEDHPAALDQSLGARLAAFSGPASNVIALEVDSFIRGNLQDLETKVVRWSGKIAGIVGSTNVAESTRLGEVAEKEKLFCVVSNNNRSVWQRRRHVFHIGLPTIQTAEAVAHQLKKAGFKQVFLVYDETDYQKHVAASMDSALKRNGIAISNKPGFNSDWLAEELAWKADLLYLAFSEEKQALPLVETFRRERPRISLLLERSLLRQSFIASLGTVAEEILFVDLFHRGAPLRAGEAEFMEILSQAGIGLPTANHAFGWDAMTLCGRALSMACGDPSLAIKHLESGVRFEGVTGDLRFNAENHSGREGLGPTVISRWRKGRLEEAFDC